VRGRHFYGAVISKKNLQNFEDGLLHDIRMRKSAFDSFVSEVRLYRDKFVAHLDDGRVMPIPKLETAKSAIWYLHHYLVTYEISPKDLRGLAGSTEELTAGYAKCVAQAEEIFRHARH
jgi:hypothetical protein